MSTKKTPPSSRDDKLKKPRRKPSYGVIDLRTPAPSTASVDRQERPRRQKKSYQPSWDDRRPQSQQTTEPEPQQQARPRRRKNSYRPQWAGGPTKTAPERTDAPAKKKYSAPPKKKYSAPPVQAKSSTNAAVEDTPVISVALISTNDASVSELLLRNIRQQSFVHPFEIVVLRLEHTESATKAIEKHKAKEVPPAKGPLSAPSIYDQVVEHCRGELAILLASDLVPDGTDWLAHMAEPLLSSDKTIVTRGKVTSHQDLSPYDAHRFDIQRNNPLDFMAFRKSTWEKHNFRSSGNLGHRWLERVKGAGRSTFVDTAVVRGRLELPHSFSEIVSSSFCNTRISLAQTAGKVVTETLADWESLNAQGLSNPGPVYARAMMVRLAENIGKTRFKGWFTQ